jgi:hypothetical protein
MKTSTTVVNGKTKSVHLSSTSCLLRDVTAKDSEAYELSLRSRLGTTIQSMHTRTHGGIPPVKRVQLPSLQLTHDDTGSISTDNGSNAVLSHLMLAFLCSIWVRVVSINCLRSANNPSYPTSSLMIHKATFHNLISIKCTHKSKLPGRQFCFNTYVSESS